MKRPSFQFYPSDWLRDTALRTCSIGARGLWMDMICYMHEGNPYGYLKVGNKVILADNLAPMVGSTLEDVEGWLHELSDAGVFDVVDGIICSRRMIRDEELRQKRAEGGKLGGNPMLKDKGKVNLEVKQNPTPSSSSSSSSSKKEKATVVALPDGFPLEAWMAFVDMRKKIKKPMTDHAMKLMIGKLEKMKIAGQDIQAVLEQSITKSWSDVYEVKLANDQFNSPKHQFNSGGNQFNRLDIIHQTTPTPANSDAALKKIIEDDKKASKPNPEVQARIAALLGDKNDKSRSTQDS